MKLALYLVLGGAFLPLAYFISKYLRSRMHPAKPRPYLLFVFGVLLLAAGFGGVALAFHGIHTGVAHCLLRACTTNPELATRPVAFAALVLWSYLVGLLLAGMGIAGMRKAADVA